MNGSSLPLVIIVTGFILSASGEPANVPASAPQPVIVYTDFEQQHSDRLLDNIKEEVQSIMVPIGVQLEWHSIGEHVPAAAEIAVVLFKGKCRMNDRLLPRVYFGTLGATYVQQDHVTPVSVVDCDCVRQFIHPSVFPTMWANRDAVLARALGRVMAHELYHILWGSKRHARNGLAKAFFTPRDLVCDHLPLEEQEASRLRNGRLHHLLAQLGQTSLR